MNKGFFYALIVAFCFSSLGVFTKFIYKYNVPSDVIFFYSSLVSSLFFFLILLFKNKNFSFLKVKKNDLVAPAIYSAIFNLFLTNTFILESLKYVDSNIQRLLTNSNPLFIILIGVFVFKDKITKKTVRDLALMLTGLFFILIECDFSGDNIFKGIFYATLPAIFVAIYSILTEKRKNNLDGLVYWFYSFLFAFLYSSIKIILSRTSIVSIFNPTLELQLLLLAIAILAFAIPYMYFLKAINAIGAEKTGIILTTAIVISMVLNFIFLHETLTPLQIVGSFFIILASVLSGLKK